MTFFAGRLRSVLFAAFVAVQVVVVVGAVAREEYLLNSGTEVRLQTRPVDPWDVLRGQFVDLGYEIDDLSNLRTDDWLGSEGDTVYIVLAEGADGLWTAVDGSRDRESETSRPEGTVVIRGEITVRSGGTLFARVQQHRALLRSRRHGRPGVGPSRDSSCERRWRSPPQRP